MNSLAGYEISVVGVLIAFARIGTALMFLPGFGEARVPARHRVALGLLISLGLLPLIPVTLPDTPLLLGLLLAREALVGLYIGAGARILFAALHSLGALISGVASLSNALAAGDPTYEGSSAIASLLTVAGVALIFVTDTHHLMLRGMLMSYETLPAVWLPMGDMAEQTVKLASKSLYLAVMIGAPFYVLGILFNLGLGLANRVMPAMPVFFVAGPATVMLGLGLLYFTAPAMLSGFTNLFAEFFLTLTP